MVRTFLLFFSFGIFTLNMYSQRLKLELGGAYYLSCVEVDAPYSKRNYHDVGIIQFSYFQKFKNNISLGLRFSYYDPYVSFNIDDYPYSNLISVASASGTFFNLAILSTYKIPILHRFNFNTYLAINNSYYRDYYGLNIVGTFGNSIEGQTAIQGTDEETGFEDFQIRPEVSVGIEWLFLKYFSLEANVAYIQGTKRIQELEVRYSLMGSEEYYAKNYSNGTMWVPSIGLSFYFGSYRKKVKNLKDKYKPLSNKKRRKVYK